MGCRLSLRDGIISRERIKNRALLMGIRTGVMPEVEHIWSVQEFEGRQVCFGAVLGCDDLGCRWRSQCLELTFMEWQNFPAGGRQGRQGPMDLSGALRDASFVDRESSTARTGDKHFLSRSP